MGKGRELPRRQGYLEAVALDRPGNPCDMNLMTKHREKATSPVPSSKTVAGKVLISASSLCVPRTLAE